MKNLRNNPYSQRSKRHQYLKESKKRLFQLTAKLHRKIKSITDLGLSEEEFEKAKLNMHALSDINELVQSMLKVHSEVTHLAQIRANLYAMRDKNKVLDSLVTVDKPEEYGKLPETDSIHSAVGGETVQQP